ncbi:MAG TPA: ParB/RepB/Spo0J family partition protein [Blastocatellia bacterium]|nr:ParB/RepB/Spo0J family partition protein [Blastocatellia bacterium]
MSRKALGRGLSALFSQSPTPELDLVDLSIDLLEPTDVQPRTVFREDKLEELAQSIKANGIIQPIVVRRSGERFQIIAGERRWRAAQKAGLHKVPCLIKDVAEENTLELSLIENLQREDLNPIEEANAFKRLLEKFQLTQEEIARRIGRDRSSITNSLRLLKLPKEIQSLVEQDKLSMGHARALLSITLADKQKAAAEQILRGQLSVRETELLVKRIQGSGRDKHAVRGHANERANVAAAELKLKRRLGAPVRIRFTGRGGVIEVKFTSSDDLSRVFDLLMQRAAL